MHIEDFKAKVAQFQVGDELKLEELCTEWNKEVDRLAAEEQEERVEEGRRDRLEELEKTVMELEDEIDELKRELKIVRSTIRTLIEEGVQ
jgi:predicted RNase H-like nuclease (RuvC/YqgF family)